MNFKEYLTESKETKKEKTSKYKINDKVKVLNGEEEIPVKITNVKYDKNYDTFWYDVVSEKNKQGNIYKQEDVHEEDIIPVKK